jgi:hypothetical protein
LKPDRIGEASFWLIVAWVVLGLLASWIFGIGADEYAAGPFGLDELFLTQRWTLLAKFDGEFANGSQTYGGSGTLRYTW